VLPPRVRHFQKAIFMSNISSEICVSLEQSKSYKAFNLTIAPQNCPTCDLVGLILDALAGVTAPAIHFLESSYHELAGSMLLPWAV